MDEFFFVEDDNKWLPQNMQKLAETSFSCLQFAQYIDLFMSIWRQAANSENRI